MGLAQGGVRFAGMFACYEAKATSHWVRLAEVPSRKTWNHSPISRAQYSEYAEIID